MSKTIWRALRFDDSNPDQSVTKMHIVAAGLQRPLIADLSARELGGKPSKITDCTSMGMDQPGAVRTDRPWEEFRIPGLKISIPSEDLLAFILRLKRCNVRRFANGAEYFKLHSWLCCLVLRPVHKVSLEVQFADRLPEAEVKAKVFWADKRAPNDVLREANAKHSKLPIERIPRGPDKVDRFIPKERGQA